MFKDDEIITDVHIGDNFISIWGDNDGNSFRLHQLEISLKGSKLDEFQTLLAKTPTYGQILQILCSN